MHRGCFRLIGSRGLRRIGRRRLLEDTLHQAIEFRSARNRQLVDVGDVRLNANMTMPGMAMTGTTSVAKGERPGVYQAAGSFAMSGAWDMTIEWNGPAGRGSAAFKGSVQ